MNIPVESIRRHTRKTAFLAAIERQLASDLFVPDRGRPQNDLDTDGSVVIVGGELFNKGAQAMTFTVVDQIRRHYPEKDIYLLSGRDYLRNKAEKEQYRFEILPWGPEVQLDLLMPNSNQINTTEFSELERAKVSRVLADSAAILDINGYALSSQQGLKKSVSYISNIMIAREYSVPMYILPQSLGPFEYSTPAKLLVNPLLTLYLQYPEAIYPRENAGVEDVRLYTTHNVEHGFDIVLQNTDYEFENIYTEIPDFQEIDVGDDSVGLVPNSNVKERMTDQEFFECYDAIVENLLDHGKEVVILRHAVEDLDLCRGIYDRFKHDETVRIYDDDLNAIELENCIDQFDFLIGSRYHSLVHAYKNSTPAIAIGWATKYRELLSEFNQLEYFFDGRDSIDLEELSVAISSMANNCSDESTTIDERLHQIRSEEFFQDIVE